MLHQCQREFEIAERNAHRTIGVNRVEFVDHSVSASERRVRIGGIGRVRVLVVLEVRAADPDECIDVACTDLEDRNVVHGVAIGQRHGLRCAALLEREATGDVHELVDG